MSRALITLATQEDRDRAIKWVGQAKPGTRIVFKQAKRTGEQNDKMWAMLTDVAAQVQWHGLKLPADDWKLIFMDALKRELRMVPNIDGTGFVNLGRSSSDLGKAEMSDLIELIHAFGAQHGVAFHDPDSISSEPIPQSPQSEVQTTPAAEVSPQPKVAGNLSDEPAQEGPSLPQGWEITYSGALRRAQKKDSLPKYASQYWMQYGGWAMHKDGPNAESAKAIYNAFDQNFGNREVIEDLLRELVP